MSTWLVVVLAVAALPLGLWLGHLVARPRPFKPMSRVDSAKITAMERELGLERYKITIRRSHGRWRVCCYVDGGYHWGSGSGAATYESARYEAGRHARTRHGAEVDLHTLWLQARESAGVDRDEARRQAREEFRRRVVESDRYVCGICGTRCPDCVRGSSDVVCHTCAACVRKRRNFERIRPRDVLANQRARSR